MVGHFRPDESGLFTYVLEGGWCVADPLIVDDIFLFSFLSVVLCCALS